MPVAGFVLIALGLILWVCNFVVQNRLPRKGMELLDSTTPEELLAGLEGFSGHARNVGRVNLVAAGMVLAGSVIVLFG